MKLGAWVAPTCCGSLPLVLRQNLEARGRRGLGVPAELDAERLAGRDRGEAGGRGDVGAEDRLAAAAAQSEEQQSEVQRGRRERARWHR